MRNLGELKLSDAKVMDTHEMKAITGGQMGTSSNCRNTGSSSGADGDTSDVRCEGDCPVVGDVTGSGKKPVQLSCQADTKTINFKSITICMCK